LGIGGFSRALGTQVIGGWVFGMNAMFDFKVLCFNAVGNIMALGQTKTYVWHFPGISLVLC
jgi:hypothetical protein